MLGHVFRQAAFHTMHMILAYIERIVLDQSELQLVTMGIQME